MRPEELMKQSDRIIENINEGIGRGGTPITRTEVLLLSIACSLQVIAGSVGAINIQMQDLMKIKREEQKIRFGSIARELQNQAEERVRHANPTR